MQVKSTVLLALLTALMLLLSSRLILAINAVGISDNGTLMLGNGTMINYTYSAQGALGLLTLYNASFISISLVVGGNVASVQLNVVITNGEYYYWAQNIAHIEPLPGSRFLVWFWNDLWNVTRPQAYLNLNYVRGSRVYPSVQRYISYYRYVEPSVIMNVKLPMTVGCMITVSLTRDGFINVSYYYEFNSSGVSTGWVRYDSVLIMDKSSQAYLIVGGFNPGNLSNDIEWVVAGYTAAAQLYVYSWNATMIMMYEYNGDWYTPAVAQSRSFDTGESVNATVGISERYDELSGLVIQSSGVVNNTYLWVPSVEVNLSGGFIVIHLTPAGARWLLKVINPRGRVAIYQPRGPVFKVKANESGRFIINATLYDGDSLILSRSYLVMVKANVTEELVIALVPVIAAVTILLIALTRVRGMGERGREGLR